MSDFSKFWMSNDDCLSGSKVQAMEAIWEYKEKENQLLKEIVQELRPDYNRPFDKVVSLSLTSVVSSEHHKLWQDVHLAKYPENL